MIIIKNWLREIASIFVFLRFKSFWNLYDYLCKNNIKKGICASVFTHYCAKKGSFIGIGAEFANHPYMPHGLHGIFISERSRIGKNCVIFHQVTIGAKRTVDSKNNGNPTIGDNCYIGSGAKIIGNIHIGNNVRIGANCVVYQDIPDNSVVVNGPTRIISREEPLDNRFVLLDGEKEVYWDFDSNSFKDLK